MKKRKQEIEDELNKVWVNGGDELAPPPYMETEKVESEKEEEQEDKESVEQVHAESGDEVENDESVEELQEESGEEVVGEAEEGTQEKGNEDVEIKEEKEE